MFLKYSNKLEESLHIATVVISVMLFILIKNHYIFYTMVIVSLTISLIFKPKDLKTITLNIIGFSLVGFFIFILFNWF